MFWLYPEHVRISSLVHAGKSVGILFSILFLYLTSEGSNITIESHPRCFEQGHLILDSWFKKKSLEKNVKLIFLWSLANLGAKIWDRLFILFPFLLVVMSGVMYHPLARKTGKGRRWALANSARRWIFHVLEALHNNDGASSVWIMNIVTTTLVCKKAPRLQTQSNPLSLHLTTCVS